jgi:hypothetical protein
MSPANRRENKMPKHNDPLAQPLKTQAQETTPRFNPLLHERIMQRIQTASDAGMHSTEMGPARMHWPLYTSLAAAAVLALALWLYHARMPSHRDIAKAGPPSIPTDALFTHAIAAENKAASKLSEYRLAYLDEDARNLGRFLKSQLDLLPRRE